MQLFFHDDRSFEFIRRPLKYSCLHEMEGERFKRSYPHFYQGEFTFFGYKGISAGPITLGFPRDIILDPYNWIPRGTDTNKKPDGTPAGLKAWVRTKAETMRHIYRAKRTTSLTLNPVDWVMIGIIVIMVIGWGVRFGLG